MNGYYIAGFVLFCIVFLIWATALDKTRVKNKRTAAEKFDNKRRDENLAARRAHRQELNSRGQSSHDEWILNPLNPLSPFYILDDDYSCSSGSGGQGQSVDVSSGGGGYSGSSHSSCSSGSSYSSSDSGSSSSSCSSSDGGSD